MDPIRLLIADDMPGAADALATTLGLACPFPIEAATTADGAEAVQSAMAGLPDCAILDLAMPVLGGAEAAARIRHEFGKRAPVLVALTGDHARATCVGSRAPFDHVMEKPLDTRALIDIIAASVSRE